MEPGQQQGQHHYFPSPFVTHKELGEVRESVGEIRATQQSIIATYNHLRGDMLNGFDKLANMIANERQLDAKRAAQAEPQGTFNFNFREMFLGALSLVMVGAFLGQFVPRGTAERAVEEVTK